MTSTFDASPKTMFEAERVLRNEEGIIRFYTVKTETTIDRANTRNFRNPLWNVPRHKKASLPDERFQDLDEEPVVVKDEDVVGEAEGGWDDFNEDDFNLDDVDVIGGLAPIPR